MCVCVYVVRLAVYCWYFAHTFCVLGMSALLRSLSAPSASVCYFSAVQFAIVREFIGLARILFGQVIVIIGYCGSFFSAISTAPFRIVIYLERPPLLQMYWDNLIACMKHALFTCSLFLWVRFAVVWCCCCP